jgi:hypothetical protein
MNEQNRGSHDMYENRREGDRMDHQNRGMNEQNRGSHNMNSEKNIHEGEFSKNKAKPYNDKHDSKEKKRKAG